MLFEEPTLNNLSHVYELYEESGMMIRTLKKLERERTKRTQKNQATLILTNTRMRAS